MKENNSFERILASVKDSLEFRFESIVLDLTEQICKKMKDGNISRSQLAKKLNVSPAAVTKILRGSSNFTLKTLLSLANALDFGLHVRFVDNTFATQAQTRTYVATMTTDLSWPEISQPQRHHPGSVTSSSSITTAVESYMN